MALIIFRNKERIRKKHKDRITLSKSRHLRSSMKDISMGDCAEISKPIYFYPEKLDDFQKYVKTSLSGLKRDKNLENYTLLIRYIITSSSFYSFCYLFFSIFMFLFCLSFKYKANLLQQTLYDCNVM